MPRYRKNVRRDVQLALYLGPMVSRLPVWYRFKAGAIIERAVKVMRDAAEGSIGRAMRWPALLATIPSMSISLGLHAGAQNADAEKLLKGMADYVAGHSA